MTSDKFDAKYFIYRVPAAEDPGPQPYCRALLDVGWALAYSQSGGNRGVPVPYVSAELLAQIETVEDLRGLQHFLRTTQTWLAPVPEEPAPVVAEEPSREQRREAFLKQERDKRNSFRDRFRVDDAWSQPGQVGYERRYKCGCGFETHDSGAIFDHECARGTPQELMERQRVLAQQGKLTSAEFAELCDLTAVLTQLPAADASEG